MEFTVKLQLDKWFRRGDAAEEAAAPDQATGQQVVNLPLDAIVPSPYQTRTEFDQTELQELAQSIREFGVIQPIIVRNTLGGYELVAGERRVRASRLCGLGEIPALIVEMTDEKAAAVTLIENVQRTSLNYLEEAEAYQLLIREFSFRQEELAQRVGKSQSTVANKMRLLKLPPEVRSAIRVDVVSERHARSLLLLDNPKRQMEVLKLIIDRELTVKATEEIIHKMRQPVTPNQETKVSNEQDAEWLAVRSYVNTIKEVVYRAKENGVNMVCLEKRLPDGYEMLIKVATPNLTEEKHQKSKG